MILQERHMFFLPTQPATHWITICSSLSRCWWRQTWQCGFQLTGRMNALLVGGWTIPFEKYARRVENDKYIMKPPPILLPPVKLTTKTPESWWLVQMNFLLGPFACFQGRDVKLQGSKEPHFFCGLMVIYHGYPKSKITFPKYPDPSKLAILWTLPLLCRFKSFHWRVQWSFNKYQSLFFWGGWKQIPSAKNHIKKRKFDQQTTKNLVETTKDTSMVGGWTNPSENMSQIGNLPQIVNMKITNLWNH